MKTPHIFLAFSSVVVAGVIISMCLLTIAAIAVEDAQMEAQHQQNINSICEQLLTC